MELFSRQAKLIFMIYIPILLVLFINRFCFHPVTYELFVGFALCLGAPSVFISENLIKGRAVEYSFGVLSLIVGALSVLVGCISLQAVINTETVTLDAVNFWVKVTRSASLLYMLPLYFLLLKGTVDENRNYEQLTGGVVINIGGQRDMVDAVHFVLSTVLAIMRSAEIRRSVEYACAHFSLVLGTIAVIALTAKCFGQATADTTVAILSLAAVVSMLHSGARLCLEEDDRPRPDVIRLTAHLFLVCIPAVLMTAGLLHACDVVQFRVFTFIFDFYGRFLTIGACIGVRIGYAAFG